MAVACYCPSVMLFFVFSIFSFSSLPLVQGAAQFLEQPPSPYSITLQTNVRTDATLNWTYMVGDKNEFKDASPVWEYKELGGAWVRVAYEDGLDSWKWKISSECPPKFLNPVRRINKGGLNATLVLQDVNVNDSGLFRCKLDMVSGSPIISREVDLIVTRATESTTTAVPMTIPSSGGRPSIPSTLTPTPSITTVTTQVPPTTVKGLSVGAIIGIAIGSVFGVICIIVIVVVLYKRYNKKREQGNLPADKKEDTEMNSPPAVNA